MSYSFTVQGKTKDEAKKAVEAAFGRVMETQPVHARDRAAALATANAVIDLLVEDDSLVISVSCNGYVGWRDMLKEDGSNDLQSASVSCSASLLKL